MPSQIQQTLEVPYSASQMYDLVNAVESYADFLPWCTNSVVLSRHEKEVKAELTLSAGGFNKSFATCNRLHKNKMIEIDLLKGPFKHLKGFWRFEETDAQGCKITLNLEFEFAHAFLSWAFNPVFHQVAHTLVDAFHQRAKQLYG